MPEALECWDERSWLCPACRVICRIIKEINDRFSRSWSKPGPAISRWAKLAVVR